MTNSEDLSLPYRVKKVYIQIIYC